MLKLYLIPRNAVDVALSNRKYLAISDEQVIKKPVREGIKALYRFTISEFQEIDPDLYSHIGIEYYADSSYSYYPLRNVYESLLTVYVMLKTEIRIPLKKDNVINYKTQDEVVAIQIP